MSQLVCAPAHSLVHQSLHATEAKTETNGDGFGLGWYGERSEPGQYREIRPAWSDENPEEPVRAGALAAVLRPCEGLDRHLHDPGELHTFVHGRHLFMHNARSAVTRASSAGSRP
jgi:glutamine amidotransferase